ncbi:MAG: hypothetical protein GWO02_01290 [Gammaproteobacteria bacterium]|nr:hypothetical protein [Gammaproteobacteria bacterium]
MHHHKRSAIRALAVRASVNFATRPAMAHDALTLAARWAIQRGDLEAGARLLAAAGSLFEYHCHAIGNAARYHHPAKKADFDSHIRIALEELADRPPVAA